MKVLKKRIIPSGWELKKIRDIASTGSGGTPLSTNKENYEGGTIPWINSGEVYGYKINSTESFITQKGLNSSSAKLFPKGSILIAMYGATAGKSSILNFEAATNQAICSIVLNNGYNHYFLKYYLDLLYDYLVGVSTGSARDNLNQKGIQDLEIPFPDIDLQNKIAKVLSNLDNKIELNNKINSELESMAKLIYDYWFVQFDFPDENGKPYKSSGGKMVYNEELKREIPCNWEVRRLNTLLDYNSGYSFPSESYCESGKWKIITIKSVKENEFDTSKCDKINELPTNLDAECNLEIGDLLMSLTGNTGRLCFVSETNCLLNQRVAKIWSSELSNYFIYLKFKRPEKQKMIEQLSSGSSQENLSLLQLFKAKDIVPENPIIKSFENKIEPIFQKILVNKKENFLLTELRDWLLPMLMNGQVTVN